VVWAYVVAQATDELASLVDERAMPAPPAKTAPHFMVRAGN
jgi:hypothetical protein